VQLVSTGSVVVTAEPTGDARWRVVVPGHRSLVTRTLVTTRMRVDRLLDGGYDLQVRLGGLEDVCADAVELGTRSDALTVEAIRLRRRTARVLTEAGMRMTDVAYLMGIPQDVAKHLLDVPVESPWMAVGHAPPTPIHKPPAATVTGGTREMTAVMATQTENGWHVHLNPGRRPTTRTSLVHAENLARARAAAGTEVVLCPSLPDDLEAALRASDVATAAADEVQSQAYELRLDVATRLRALGIGFADIGELLAIHTHRVRLLLR
jgi:hypothetical protein